MRPSRTPKTVSIDCGEWPPRQTPQGWRPETQPYSAGDESPCSRSMGRLVRLALCMVQTPLVVRVAAFHGSLSACGTRPRLIEVRRGRPRAPSIRRDCGRRPGGRDVLELIGGAVQVVASRERSPNRPMPARSPSCRLLEFHRSEVCGNRISGKRLRMCFYGRVRMPRIGHPICTPWKVSERTTGSRPRGLSNEAF